MKKHYIKLIIWFVSTTAFSQVQGVGINEDNPQQALHLGSSTGTIRVDGLNSVNSTYNGGGTDTYPLYVDGNGNLTLEFKPLYNSNGSDALDHAVLPGSVVTLLAGDNDGTITGELFNFTIAVNRASILEVKYNVSMDVFLNPIETAIIDRRARRVNTYFQVNGVGRKYGHAGKCYTGGSLDSETGKLFNTSTSYISLPAAGSYVIRFYGEVSSGITNTTANTGLATCVKFARGNDSLLLDCIKPLITNSKPSEKMKNQYLYLLFYSSIGFSQVGIGTTNPQEELHIAGNTSTIRIEGLSSANNPLNDGIKNAKVFVDSNGNFTLTPPNFTAGGSGNGNLPLNFLIDVPNFIPDNVDGLPAPYDSLGRIVNSDLTQESVEGFIFSATFTVPQACTVEVKHGVTLVISGINMLVPPRLAYINDSKTRTIQTYFCFDINNDGLSPAEKALQYGNKGQFYCSVAGGSLGYPYMNSQGYATLPPGTHSIHFFGIVQDPPNTFTSVGFGGATDYLKLRVYN